MIRVQRSTISQRECHSHSVTRLDAREYGQVVRWSEMQASSDYVQGVVEDTVDEASVSTVTPDWCVVLSC